jgi:hypothetical protein
MIWQANPRGAARGLSLISPATGQRLPASLRADFDATSTAILRRGVVVVSGRSVNTNVNNGSIFIPRDRLNSLYFTHTFEKAIASTSHPSQVLFTSQRDHQLFRVDLRNARGYTDPTMPYPVTDADKVWKADTGPGPRGVVQGRSRGGHPGRIWVACKGSDGTCSEFTRGVSEIDVRPYAQIRSYLANTGASGNPPVNPSIDRIGRANPLGDDDGLGMSVTVTIPIGPRGICVAPNGDADDIWVTCYGYELFQDSNPDCINMGISGTGYSLVRIRDNRPSSATETQLPSDAVRVFNPGGTEPRGPLGIAADIFGNVFVVCSTRRELWRIPPGFEPSGSTIPLFDLAPPGGGATGGWRVVLPGTGRDRPSGVSIDGYGRACVQYKSFDGPPRITFVDTGGLVDDHIIGDPETEAGTVATENVGDFTGYWTAVGLFPSDDSNHDMCSNLDSVLRGQNPFLSPARP